MERAVFRGVDTKRFMATSSTVSTTAGDPWFQDRFAARIGGASYGKGNEIYKFELIKRAKRQALADSTSGSVRTTRWLPRWCGP